MKILVLGGDGRAHALVWKLFNSATTDVFVAPGNGGATQLAPMVELDPTNAVEVARWAFDEGMDLIVPADSSSLAAGLVDEVVTMHIGVCGPAQRAVQIERSRCFARTLLERHRLPVLRGRVCSDLATAEKYLAAQPLPVVIRADQPEYGQGVYADRYSALEALRTSFAEASLSGPVAGVVIEEHRPGIVVRMSALSDGSSAVPLLPVRIYDQLGPEFDSPVAPGMGAISSNSVYAQRLGAHIYSKIIQPLVLALSLEHLPYWGFLGVDCLVTDRGPRVVALRCSLGDMEAQVVLPRLEDDLMPLLEATVAHRLQHVPPLRWRDEAAVAIGLVAQGYPHHFPIGAAVDGLNDVDQGVLVFHNQTQSPGAMRYTPASYGSRFATLLRGGPSPLTAAVYVTGGHVATVVATSATLAGARGRALLNAERISFPGRMFREDIGRHEFR
ncbi:phosphoribosylamine--glycine ligase [Candidatus Viridilinea mediisalina]|uniref:phosphoribosylamine--glycine ligase n=1 Tax=Candidatus Viridilinea mediisalina TaxID=2024553 RepID=A0A2A6RG57_9CHLR|nr:phosphoribosylglycinamide synthetase C domain-containing protein [Candidatus Viridilinea mediisalina]PDW02114.1 phosphoribosylamine--glycine ligase [Candidatus Viridilinea mediisalina]